ncbi:MAG: hypothetical protein WC683_04560 [bacterium]
MAEERVKKADIDELLESEALVLVLGGKEYRIVDFPLGMWARLREMKEDDPAAILKMVLGPLGFADEDLERLGEKAVRVATEQLIAHFFAPSALEQNTPGMEMVRAFRASLIGPEPSPSSSAPIPATGSATSPASE